MGCAQTSGSVMPLNHIPIERLYVNEDYPVIEPPPAILITGPPVPSYVKSVLKKPYPDGRGRIETIPLIKPKPLASNKTVNFDEQVLVKSRTPTPNKIWYEKASSTMPMRKHPRNDDDHHDYDDEEIPSVSSDEDLETGKQSNTELQIPSLGPPTSFLQPNQANTFWYNSNTIAPMPLTNTLLDNESYPLTTQQQPPYAAENHLALPANRIKVRRRLPDLGPPQTLPASLYQPPLQSSTIPSYQSPINNVLLRHPSVSINSTSSPQTAYYAFNRHPTENVT